MMKKIILAIVLIAVKALPVTVVNECPHEVWLAFGLVHSGGADDLNGGVSWAKFISSGWYPLGPYEKTDYAWAKWGSIFAKSPKGRVVSVFNGLEERFMPVFCLKDERFSFEFTDKDEGRRMAQCSNAGGYLQRFERMVNREYQALSTYRIFNTRCDR